MSILQKFFGKKDGDNEKSKGKTCSACGATSSLDVRFCPSCGNEFHVISDSFDAFISYRRETGSELASLIKIQLENRFHKAIFLDVNELQVGRFDEELLNRIENTPNFIVILSRASLDRCANKSDWLKREIMHALITERNIIPLMTEGFTFPSDELWALLPPEMKLLPSLNGVSYSHIHQESSIRKIASYMKGKAEIKNRKPAPDPQNKIPYDKDSHYEDLLKEATNKIRQNVEPPRNQPTNTPLRNNEPKINSTRFVTTISDKQEVYGTWDLKDSPLYIHGEAIVPKGKTLTIVPGVTVHFRTGSNVDYLNPNFDRGFLRVNGKLIACGSKDATICFKGDDPDRWKSWGSIIIHTDDPGSELLYCTFEQSYCVQNAITITGIGKSARMSFWGALSLYKSNARIENCIFVNNTYAAVSCDRSSPVIVGTTIINDGNYPSSSFSGVSCRDKSCPRIINCTIVCKKGRGVLSYASVPFIENSIIVVESSSQSKTYPQTRSLLSYSLLKVKDSDEIYIDNGGNLLEQDPQFADRESGDFHLKTNSPCIAAGRGKADLGAFPLNLWVDPLVPDMIDDNSLSMMISKYSVYPARAIVELDNDRSVELTNFFIRDHGAPVSSIMLSEKFDMNAIVSLKEIKNIHRISEDTLEFTLINGSSKTWNLGARGVTGIDSESRHESELDFREVKNVEVIYDLENIIKLDEVL